MFPNNCFGCGFSCNNHFNGFINHIIVFHKNSIKPLLPKIPDNVGFQLSF